MDLIVLFDNKQTNVDNVLALLYLCKSFTIGKTQCNEHSMSRALHSSNYLILHVLNNRSKYFHLTYCFNLLPAIIKYQSNCLKKYLIVFFLARQLQLQTNMNRSWQGSEHQKFQFFVNPLPSHLPSTSDIRKPKNGHLPSPGIFNLPAFNVRKQLGTICIQFVTTDIFHVYTQG